ncbi:BapA/Bap/LapF family prefix-like domain-containing protein, partial [Ignatzschineria indica]
MINFIVVEKDSLDKSVVSSAHLTLSEPSIVHTKMSRDDVAEFVRDGNNLLLKLKNGKVIVIENFFVKQDDVASDLVFEEDDCFLFWFDGTSGFSEISGLEALLPAAGSSELGALFPWLVGVGLGGGVIAASNGGNSGGSLSSTPNGEIAVTVNEEGKITGSTKNLEPGSEVTLTIEGTGKDGEPLTQEITTTVSKDGSYNAEVPADFVDGDLEVTAKTFDRNGNLVTDQDDLTKTDQDENPETPVQGGLDRTPGDIEVKVDDKGKITGTTTDVEPGSQVTLTIQGTGKDGEPLTQEITTTVSKDGSYNAEVPADFVDGDLEVTAKTFDRNGNFIDDEDSLGGQSNIFIPGHGTGPREPEQSGLDRTDGKIEVTIDRDNNQFVGITEDVASGNVVVLVVKGQDSHGEPLTQYLNTTVKADGSYEIEIPMEFADGDLQVNASTTDRNGNVVTDYDTATIDRVNGDIEVEVDDQGVITGTTTDVEPGSQVTLTIQGTGKDGEPLTQEVMTTVNKDGSYNAEVPVDFVDGDLEVTATTFDRNGNQVTDQDDLTKIDHDENPETPVQGGLDRTPGDIEVKVDAKGKITGTTTDVEPGSQVTLTIQGTGKDGEPLTQEITTTVNKDGSYNAEVPADFVDGELEVTATTFDRNGNLVTDQDDLTKIDHDENPETPVQGGLDRTPGDIEVEVDVKGKI